MRVEAATCGFMKVVTARLCPRTASVPIGTVSAGGGRCARTYSGQRPRQMNHTPVFSQFNGILGR
jgi:hypothetical protein